MSEISPARERLTFLVIAIAIMLFIDQFVLGGGRPYLDDIRDEGVALRAVSYDETYSERQQPEDVGEVNVAADLQSGGGAVYDLSDAEHGPETGFSEVEDMKSAIQSLDFAVHSGVPLVENAPEIPERTSPPLWKKHAVKVNVPDYMAKVAVILDDMGVNKSMTEAATDLPGPLTLSFLPYAKGGAAAAERAAGRGHEIMVHMPMEPLNAGLDPGPDVLSSAMTEHELVATLDRGLDVYSGYVGINNHMGSKLTQDARSMSVIMKELRERGLVFVDSRTISSSVADKTAEDFGVAHASRDVFLDHNQDYESVKRSLKNLERIATEHGQAIAIGHPKSNTIRALYEWLPTLEDKGIALVPVSALVREPEMEAKPEQPGGGVIEASAQKSP